MILASLFVMGAFAAVVEVNDSGNPVSRVPSVGSSSSTSLSTDSSMRSTHRVGLGAKIGGALGVGGTALDLNISKFTSVGLGFGVDPNYGSFHVEVRNILTGQTILPYFSYGYARWYNRNDEGIRVSQLRPDFLRDRLIRNTSSEVGDFAFDFLTPAVGVQYIQSSGPWAGLSLSLEAVMLLNLQRFVSLPVGSLNCLYYF